MTDDWREDGEWGSVLEVHQILDGAGVADSAAVEDRVRLVVERAEKAEAAAREMGQALRDVAMLLRTIDIHAPESRAWAALARHPEFAPDISPPQMTKEARAPRTGACGTDA